MPGDARGIVMCGAASVLVGASVAVMPVLDDYPAPAGQALRYAGAAALLGLVALSLPRRPRRPQGAEWLRLTGLVAVGLAGFNLALIAAVGRVSPALVGSVVGAAPVVLVLSAALAARRTPRWSTLSGACVVCVGVAVGNGGSTASALGLLLAGVALACEVGFTLLAGPLLPRLGPLVVSAYACALAVPLLAAVHVAAAESDVVIPSRTELLALTWLSLVTTAGGFLLWYAGVARLGPARAGLFTGLIPVGALAATGLVASGQGITLRVVVGASVAGAGLVLGMVPPGRAGGTRRHALGSTAQRMPIGIGAHSGAGSKPRTWESASET